MIMAKIRGLIRNYFSLTQSERRGFILVSLFLIIAIVSKVISGRIVPMESFDYSEVSGILEELRQAEQMTSPKIDRSFFLFDPNSIAEEAIDSLDIPERIKRNILKYRQSGGTYKKAEDLKKIYGMTDSLFALISPYIYFPAKPEKQDHIAQEERIETGLFFFDPNTTSVDSLKKLGFTDFAASNLRGYVSKGGIIRYKEDLSKIYGIEKEFFDKVYPYIKLPSLPVREEQNAVAAAVELNDADSSSLVAVPWIGPAFASRILRYRKLLGGFYSVEQIHEVYGMTDEVYARINPYLKADSHKIKMLKINLAEYTDLRAHPYISPRQARLIVDRRSSRGPWENIEELMTDTIFTVSEYKRISPYLIPW
jgi:DNA uptake protein ComE-like DNA-binding protein